MLILQEIVEIPEKWRRAVTGYAAVQRIFRP